MEIIIISLLAANSIGVAYIVFSQARGEVSSRSKRPIFVDTSVLIDGRILQIAESGFMSDTLVIPRSVIGELQYLADNSDHEKRSRARHGLDIVHSLQSLPGIDVEILQDGSQAKEGVDERLLNLAKRYKGVVCTIDYNLNKVAQVEGILVLNVNELARTLRMVYLPGETLRIELTQRGQDAHQAVGHLPDGTMVVVEQASKYIGTSVDVEFVRSLQTAAGRMMFAKVLSGSDVSTGGSAVDARKGAVAKKVPSKIATGRRAGGVKSGGGRSRVESKKSATTSSGSRRRKTQADREDSLIELVNSQ